MSRIANPQCLMMTERGCMNHPDFLKLERKWNLSISLCWIGTVVEYRSVRFRPPAGTRRSRGCSLNRSSECWPNALDSKPQLGQRRDHRPLHYPCDHPRVIPDKVFGRRTSGESLAGFTDRHVRQSELRLQHCDVVIARERTRGLEICDHRNE